MDYYMYCAVYSFNKNVNTNEDSQKINNDDVSTS